MTHSNQPIKRYLIAWVEASSTSSTGYFGHKTDGNEDSAGQRRSPVELFEGYQPANLTAKSEAPQKTKLCFCLLQTVTDNGFFHRPRDEFSISSVQQHLALIFPIWLILYRRTGAVSKISHNHSVFRTSHSSDRAIEHRSSFTGPTVRTEPSNDRSPFGGSSQKLWLPKTKWREFYSALQVDHIFPTRNGVAQHGRYANKHIPTAGSLLLRRLQGAFWRSRAQLPSLQSLL